MRVTQFIAVLAIAAAAVAACSAAPTPTATSTAPTSRAAAAPTSAAAPETTQQASAPTTVATPETVTIKLSVKSIAGDFGDYIVDLHDGNVAKQTTFDVDKKGTWSKTITVPNASMVKLDIAQTGATCTIAVADTGKVLVTDENSCIVGS